jgi:hypothetical protein
MVQKDAFGLYLLPFDFCTNLTQDSNHGDFSYKKKKKFTDEMARNRETTTASN